ncbi:hypothetical protein [Aestuariirhabdus litorea]|uniref:Uncharacterized protein n=1 Tax=Aestuariirhabdus litorea TaxID=2528527 RepID=A0A3P3VPM1_9GAMM|nr:hypothetical protein [Aestuariirhabdus litorea]RRJ84721.1 hypothetical protein D0544_06360 [Aestuariirhabdus litorea]RWW97946.1 hypothetical protein DZC74_06355 [Endozoicomonadaceae bacterium GTF-13]
MDKTLAFEITCIFLLLALGTGLLTQGLPGWGLVSVSALLALGSSGLRLLNGRQNSLHPSAS